MTAWVPTVELLAPQGGFDWVIDVVAYDDRDVELTVNLPCCQSAHCMIVSTTYLYDECAAMPHREDSPIAREIRLGGYCLGKAMAEQRY